MILIPAYGRDYKSKDAVKKDWDDQKDFLISDFSCPEDGKYVNKQQLPNQTVKIRYNKLRDVVTLRG